MKKPSGVPPRRSSVSLCTTHLLMHDMTGGRRVPVPICLAYSTEDPYTVYLDSHARAETQVTWAVSRDLLTAGIRGRAGGGDVSVCPGHDGDAGSVHLLLAGHGGTPDGDPVLLRARTPDIEAFLQWTEHVVPPGREGEYLDLDTLIGHLLDHGPGA
ncbi:hypothetical protein GCM10010415_30800 [Streptomyces atrovirens]|uniref:SsgA family sporulation/cell division regulator n=1 Tax=Streptomyces atrovirens TaxID=285556 RepID=A0ABW0DWU6_9ACTN